MMKLVKVLIASSLLAGTAQAAPHIAIADARKVALARVPGTIVHEKLKHKKHGHDLYYFKVKPRDAKTTMLKKVEVDSESGQIVKIKDVKPKDKDD